MNRIAPRDNIFTQQNGIQNVWLSVFGAANCVLTAALPEERCSHESWGGQTKMRKFFVKTEVGPEFGTG